MSFPLVLPQNVRISSLPLICTLSILPYKCRYRQQTCHSQNKQTRKTGSSAAAEYQRRACVLRTHSLFSQVPVGTCIEGKFTRFQTFFFPRILDVTGRLKISKKKTPKNAVFRVWTLETIFSSPFLVIFYSTSACSTLCLPSLSPLHRLFRSSLPPLPPLSVPYSLFLPY